MRCKPNEMALIFRVPAGGRGYENIGIIVTLVAVDGDGDWKYRDASRPIVIHALDKFMATNSDDHPDYMLVIPDSCLLPIRWPDGEEPIKAAEPRAASKRLTDAEFEAAQDRWIQGVDA